MTEEGMYCWEEREGGKRGVRGHALATKEDEVGDGEGDGGKQLHRGPTREEEDVAHLHSMRGGISKGGWRDEPKQGHKED